MGANLMPCYITDLVNFLNLLTGDPFYTTEHPESYAKWGSRLSSQAQAQLHGITQVIGSPGPGPALSFILALHPRFPEVSIEEFIREWGRVSAQAWSLYPQLVSRYRPEQVEGLLQAVGAITRELEDLGFRDYWQQECLPEIQTSISHLNASLSTILPLVLSEIATRRGLSLEIYLQDPVRILVSAFAAPHAIRLHGKNLMIDLRYPAQIAARNLTHELLHSPWDWEEFAQERDILLTSAFFQKAFRDRDPHFGYPTPESFLEENLVEAMELEISAGLGLIEDPIEYLLLHDEGSHRLSVVWYHFLKKVPRGDTETMAEHFRRVVEELPLETLQDIYEAETRSR